MLYIWEDQDIHHGTETLTFVGEEKSAFWITEFKRGNLFAIIEDDTGHIMVGPLTSEATAEWLTLNGHMPAEISHGPGKHKNPYVWADSIGLNNLPTHRNMPCVTKSITGFDPAEPGGDKTAIGQVIKGNRSAEMFGDNPAQRSFGDIAPSLPDLPDLPEPPMAPMAPPGLPVPPAPTAPKAPPAPPAPQVSRQSESLSLRSGSIPSSPATDEDKLGDMQRAPSEDMLGDPFA